MSSVLYILGYKVGIVDSKVGRKTKYHVKIGKNVPKFREKKVSLNST